MKQNNNCLAPGAGGGGGVGAPFSKRDALSSAGLGDVSLAVMLPLRALIYRCLIAFGERDVADGCRLSSVLEIGWSGGALQQFDSRQLCYARYLPTSSYRGRCQNFYIAALGTLTH